MIRRFDPLSIPLTGTHLIEAGAGTGKTYAITGLVVRLLVERGWPVDRILVVTYTRAAMAELRERVRTRIQEGLAALQAGGDPEDDLLDHLARRSRAAGTVHRDGRRLASALSSFDQAAILTIHGFCRKMLADSAFESGLPFDTEFLENQALLVREIAHDFWVGRMMEAPASLVRFLTERKASQQVRPDTLVCLATKAADHREMPLVPGRPAPADPGAEKAWHTAYVQAAGIWREEKDPVIDLLCRSQALNRNKYRAASIRGLWAVQMDALMSSAVPPIPESFQRFVKFTPAELQEGCKKGRTPPEHPFFAACEALKKADDRCRADFEARETALHLDLVEFARAEMVRRKERDGSRTFDDLLYLMRDGVRSPEGEQLRAFLRARFFAVLIDEFQDTDPVQYELFHEVYHQEAGGSDAALFLIGDPKQAIYAFRGADIFTYMEARRQAGGHLHSLQTNWRSDAKLIRAVNTLYGRTRRPFFMETVAFKPVEPAPPGAERCGEDAGPAPPFRILLARRDPGRPAGKVLTTVWANEHLPAGIAADILRLEASGQLPCGRALRRGEIAVLCRTNRQLELIQKALRSAGIPSVLEGEASVFDSPEASEIQRVLRGVAAPLDARAVRAALSTTLLGVSGDELAALQQDEAGWSLWAARFREWHDLWRRSGFIRAYRKILAETRASRRFLSQPGGDRQLTNLFHLGELLEAEAIRRQSGPLELLRWLHVMRQDPLARSEGLASEAAQIRLESDLKAVKLVTIHKSKGLEYDAVYCPYLWQGTKLFPGEERWPRFHDPADRHRLKMDVGSQARQEHLAWATKEEQAERTRLTYVALTRARHLCTVVWGAFRDAEKSPLHVLLMKMPEEVRTADPRDVKWTPIHRLSDEAIHGELKLLEEEAPGAIGVEWFEDELAQEVEDPAARGGKKTMAARTLSRRLSSFWRISSFSALTASEDEEIRPDLPDRDHDAEQEAAGRRDRDAPAPRPEHPVLLDSFPRGSRAGQMIHTVLENIDFRQTDPAALAPAVERALEGYGFPLGFRDRLAAALAAVFKTRLLGQGEGLTLSDLSPEQRLNEMEFTYPVGGHGRTLTSAGLANVLRSEPEPPWPPSYPDQVERTGFLPLEGFLRGFADLVFTYRERWYLVDYKSNHLGPDAADYAPEQLPTVMASHHYFLQYHIYMVALHRYLSFRIRHYDPARHLGGVFYLFLRGMSPEHPAGCGIFRHRPSLQILESLSRLMEDGASRQEWP